MISLKCKNSKFERCHAMCALSFLFVCLCPLVTTKIEKMILCLSGESLRFNEKDKKRYYLHKKIVKLNNFLFII